jgi:antagonist of KipI
MSIKVVRPGLLTSIQDLGRVGYQKYGVIAGGVMDPYSCRLANVLVGNDEDEAVLELTLTGPCLEIENDMLVAITGGDLSPTVDGMKLQMWSPVFIRKGSVLQFGKCVAGCRSYMSVAGGYDVPEVLGSKSTYIRAGIGGHKGRALEAGDRISIQRSFHPRGDRMTRKLEREAKKLNQPFAAASWRVQGAMFCQTQTTHLMRVVAGRQAALFAPDSLNRFFESAFKVAVQSDRMGYRLAGPTLELGDPLEMISEAVAAGCVQVPPDGNPIVLLADRQTVGGYPIIAHVILTDIAAFSNVKPGEEIRFQEISLSEAQTLYLEREEEMNQLKGSIRFKHLYG